MNYLGLTSKQCIIMKKEKKLNRHNYKGCELEGDVMTPCQEEIAIK